MYPSTNTHSGPNDSTEITTFDPAPLNFSYVSQTEFITTIKYLKVELKESEKEFIADQDEKMSRQPKKRYSPYHSRSKIFHPKIVTKPSNDQIMKNASRT